MTYQANTQEIWASGVFINIVKYKKKCSQIFFTLQYFGILKLSKVVRSLFLSFLD